MLDILRIGEYDQVYHIQIQSNGRFQVMLGTYVSHNPQRGALPAVDVQEIRGAMDRLSWNDHQSVASAFQWRIRDTNDTREITRFVLDGRTASFVQMVEERIRRHTASKAD